MLQNKKKSIRFRKGKKTLPDFSSALVEMEKRILALKGRMKKAGFARIEVEIEAQCILSWLSRQSDASLLYWSDREKEFQVGGVGVADQCVLTNSQYTAFFRRLKERLSLSRGEIRYYGGIAFDALNLEEEWAAFGCGRFWLPRFEMIRRDFQMFLACNVLTGSDHSESISETISELKKLKAYERTSDELIPDLLFRQDYPDYASWVAISRDAIDTMKSEGHQKIVLARKTSLKLVQPMNPFIFLREVERNTNHCYCFCFQPQHNNAFLGASPERLYSRRKQVLKSEAIAGTRPRGPTPLEDEQLAADLLNSKKDVLEHQYVVDFLKKSFAALCREIKSTESLSILKLKEGMHLISRMEGLLKLNSLEGDLLKKFHPTPAVGGAPNRWAIPMIAFYEPFVRGWYTGPVGWVSKDESEFAVGIRSALLQEDHISLFSGAGIVEGSNPYNEWQEIEHKMSSFIKMFRNHDDEQRIS